MQQLQPFNFDSHQVRVIHGDDGEPMFVAKDVAEALGYTWNGASRISHVPQEWRGVTSVVTPSGNQQTPAPTRKGAQLEDGYVRTANALVEALCKAPLTSREARIVRAVERATFGWDRSSARLSQSVLAKMTGLTPKRCSEAVNSLLAKKVLRRDGGSQSPIGINTRVGEWDFSSQKARVSPKRQPDPNWGLRPHLGDEKRPQDGDTNTDTTDNLLPKGSKESSKKSAPRKWGEEIDHELVTEMVAAVSADLDAPVKHNPTTWANEFRLMRERDGRTVEQIRYLIAWTAKHEFWAGVVMSPKKLRDKWDQLAKQVKQQQAKPAARPMTQAERLHAANQQAIREAVARRQAQPAGVDDLLDNDGGHW